MLDNIKKAYTKLKSKFTIKKSYNPNIHLGYPNGSSAIYVTPSILEQEYNKNPIAYKCMSVIMQCMNTLEIDLVKKQSNELVMDRVLLEYLEHPNVFQNRQEFLEQLLLFYTVHGEVYIYETNGDGMYIIDPKMVNKNYKLGMNENDSVFPVQYTVMQMGQTFNVNPETGLYLNGNNETLHRFAHYSFTKEVSSPIIGCFAAIYKYNKASEWNTALLMNRTIMSMVITNDSPYGQLSDEQQLSLKEQLNSFRGLENAGQVIVLDPGLKLDTFGMSPEDMQYDTLIKTTALTIAGAMGVPFPLITNEASTYNNMEEAYEKLYQNTVMPTLKRLLEKISYIIDPTGTREFVINKESVPSMETTRTLTWNRMIAGINAGLITANEGREELGYEKMDDPLADELAGKLGADTQSFTNGGSFNRY